jgi:hypothetical protein
MLVYQRVPTIVFITELFHRGPLDEELRGGQCSLRQSDDGCGSGDSHGKCCVKQLWPLDALSTI